MLTCSVCGKAYASAADLAFHEGKRHFFGLRVRPHSPHIDTLNRPRLICARRPHHRATLRARCVTKCVFQTFRLFDSPYTRANLCGRPVRNSAPAFLATFGAPAVWLPFGALRHCAFSLLCLAFRVSLDGGDCTDRAAAARTPRRRSDMCAPRTSNSISRVATASPTVAVTRRFFFSRPKLLALAAQQRF